MILERRNEPNQDQWTTEEPTLVTSLRSPAAARWRRILSVGVAALLVVAAAGAVAATVRALDDGDTTGTEAVATAGSGLTAGADRRTADQLEAEAGGDGSGETDPAGPGEAVPGAGADGADGADGAAAPADADAAVDGDDQAELDVAAGLPDRASRLDLVGPVRLLDTRQDDPVEPGGTVTLDLAPYLDPAATGVVVSIAITGAAGPGVITANLDEGPVVVAEAGARLATGIGFVARDQADQLRVTSEGGAHLVVDLVGVFVADGPSAAGRIVPVAPQPLTRLVTAVDGPRATVQPLGTATLPSTGVAALVVRVGADVGDRGGVVTLGPGDGTGEQPNLMLWGPAGDTDNRRFGVAIVTLDELGRMSLDYDGGSVLDLELLGYVTDEDAAVDTAGLFVPIAPTTVVDAANRGGATLPAAAAASIGIEDPIAGLALAIAGRADDIGDLVSFDPRTGLPRSATLEIGGGGRRTTTSLVATAPDGAFSVFTDVTTDVTVDVTGYVLGRSEG
ncbi:MAG: hypothetical protein AAF547_03700 [Actinomycetota bacterium]